MSSPSTNSILVIGSKPSSLYLNIDYDVAISANGAVNLLKYISCKKRYSVVSSGAIENTFILDSLRQANFVRTILRCHGKSDFSKVKDYFLFDSVFEGLDMTMIEYSIFGNQVYLCFLMTFFNASSPKRFLSMVLRHFTSKYRAFACSTGLWSIAYARYYFPNHSIFVSGISLRSGGHFHGNQTGNFENLTAQKDCLLAKCLGGKNIFSTDENFCRISGSTLVNSNLRNFPSV